MADSSEAVTLAGEPNVEGNSAEVIPKEEPKQEEYKVFVGNLAFSTDEQQLADFFNKTGKV